MNKKIIALLSVLVLCVGCSSKPVAKVNTTIAQSNSIVQTQPATTSDWKEFDKKIEELNQKITTPITQPEKIGIGEKLSFDTYDVVVTGIEKATSYKGEDLVLIVYDYTNKSDEARSSILGMRKEVYQDGIELKESGAVDERSRDINEQSVKKAQKGSTVKGCGTYYKVTSKNEIELVFGDRENFKKPKVVRFKVPAPK